MRQPAIGRGALTRSHARSLGAADGAVAEGELAVEPGVFRLPPDAVRGDMARINQPNTC